MDHDHDDHIPTTHDPPPPATHPRKSSSATRRPRGWSRCCVHSTRVGATAPTLSGRRIRLESWAPRLVRRLKQSYLARGQCCCEGCRCARPRRLGESTSRFHYMAIYYDPPPTHPPFPHDTNHVALLTLKTACETIANSGRAVSTRRRRCRRGGTAALVAERAEIS